MDLVLTYRGTVMPWHCDHMGHMNVMWYRRELYVGETVSVQSAFLEVREKVAKFVHEMRNNETGEIAALCVLTGVHIDAKTRKSCPFPEDILARARSLVRAYPPPS